MEMLDAIVVGAGPCGLSAAIELQEKGFSVLVIEKGNVVNSIYHYPTHQTFFSSSIKLSIGDIPFITEKEKPKRNDALVYYRTVASLKDLTIHHYEKVLEVNKQQGHFIVKTTKAVYEAKQVVIATGYYDNPNKLPAEGADLPKVFHYFKEAHPFFQKKVVVIGGKNSAVDAAIELQRAGAQVTVVYRGREYSPSVKPWILPGFDSLVRHGEIDMLFNAIVTKITDTTVTVLQNGKEMILENDYVFAMIGYHPDHPFLQHMGVKIDEESGKPFFNEETMETNVDGIYIAGVIAAGNNTNEIFIENGKFHGGKIATHLFEKKK